MFSLTPEEEMIAATARDSFAATEERLRCGADWAAEVASMAELGWLGMPFESPAQGAAAVLAAEAAGATLLPVPFADVALAVPAALAEWGEGAAVRKAVAAGEEVWVSAGVEAVVDGLRGRASVTGERHDRGWRLDGRAHRVQAARPHAGYVVVAREGDGGAPLLFAVPAGAAGVTVEPERGGDESCPTATVTFTATPVFAEHRLPPAALDRLLRWGAAGAAAEMLGAATTLRGLAVEHAQARHQFGRPIGSFQAVQHMCADIHVLVESLRVAVWAAGLSIAAGGNEGLDHVAVAKSYAGEAARRVGELALQVHGGIGFTWEHPLHRYLKRIVRLGASFGETRWHRERLVAERPA